MYQAIVFFPLLGALIAGLFGRIIGDRPSELISSGLLILSALMSCIAFVDVGLNGEAVAVNVLQWIHSGSLHIDWVLRIDTLTAVMLVVATCVSSMEHVYSIGYMSHDPARPRFFAYLSLFTFMMLMLVTADNFVQLFFGWEGVGLASYLLIGFWYKKPSANAAAIKAFVVNRVGDFGLILGMSAIYFTVGSLEFDTVFAAAGALAKGQLEFLGFTLPTLTTICLLLFMGAMGKSAQFFLHTWYVFIAVFARKHARWMPSSKARILNLQPKPARSSFMISRSCWKTVIGGKSKSPRTLNSTPPTDKQNIK